MADTKLMPVKNAKALLDSMQAAMLECLPATMSPERMARVVLTQFRQNPKLLECSSQSVAGSILMTCQLGLEPGVLGQSYLVPFYSNKLKCFECQFMVGYQGYHTLFYRADPGGSIEMMEVREGDTFDYQHGTDPYLIFKPGKTRGNPTHYYTVARTGAGGKFFSVMTAEDCLAHGLKYSKMVDRKTGKFYPTSVWASNPGAMSMKTTSRKLAKVLPLAIMRAAQAADESVRHFVPTGDLPADFLSLPNEIETEVQEVIETPPVPPRDIFAPADPAEPEKTEPKALSTNELIKLNADYCREFGGRLPEAIREALGVDKEVRNFIPADVAKMAAYMTTKKKVVA